MNFGNEAEVSKASAQIWQSRAGMKSTVEWMVPARRALPTLEAPPVSPVNPAWEATRVRLATVAARYSWNRVLARPKQRDWRDSQLDQPRQPVLHHHAALPVLGKGLASDARRP